jgi:UDP-N-acetylglucosamine:LPS N-acetylglucosamine transferase
MTKKKVVLLVFGEGGHQKEMELLLAALPKNQEFEFITIGPNKLLTSSLHHYFCNDVRNKNSRIASIFSSLQGIFKLTFSSLSALNKFNVTGAISTGPGIAIIPFIIMRLFKKKTLFIESFCRFNTKSFAGKVLYKVSSRFLVQNEELLALYPNAEYCGRL